MTTPMIMGVAMPKAGMAACDYSADGSDNGKAAHGAADFGRRMQPWGVSWYARDKQTNRDR